MKKILSILSFICLMAVAGQVNAQNSNGLAGQAIAAYQQQCGSYNGAIDAQVNVISICFFQGFITEVILTPRVNCNQVDCDLVRIPAIARVVFGCDNEVMSVECLYSPN